MNPGVLRYVTPYGARLCGAHRTVNPGVLRYVTPYDVVRALLTWRYLEGMFNNANTIFRTKFVDGVSTVTRTVPALKDKAGRCRLTQSNPR